MIQLDLQSHTGWKALFVGKIVVLNVIIVVGLIVAASKHNKNGLIRLILFVASLGDYLFTYRAESTLILAIAIALISPQEFKPFFSSFVVMAYYELDDQFHSHSVFHLLYLGAYFYFTNNFIAISQEMLSGRHCLKPVDRDGLEVNPLQLNAFETSLVSVQGKLALAPHLVSVVLNTIVGVFLALEVLFQLFASSQASEDHWMPYTASILRSLYFLLIFFVSLKTLITAYTGNLRQIIKHY